MINVFFPYYNPNDSRRQKEIELCLDKNIENPNINKIIVMIDDNSNLPVINEKIITKRINQRPTYRLWIELTKELNLDGVSILCNSDIYFNDSLAIAVDIINTPQKFLSLSRWELLNNNLTLHPNPHWSQDSWGFHTASYFSKEMLKLLDFPMGVPRCDNKIAYIFAIQGWKIYNPCQTLKSIHVHETQLRTYDKNLDDRILGGVAYVYPGEQGTDEAELDFDIWSKRTKKISKISINKSLERWIEKHSNSEKKEHNKALPKTFSSINLNFKNASSYEVKLASKSNEVVFSKGVNFKVLKYNNYVYINNLYTPRNRKKIELDEYNRATSEVCVSGLIPPVIDTFVTEIEVKTSEPSNLNFWQYPCATEQQAYNNHTNLALGENLDVKEKVINTYLPLPWATYIDKKDYPTRYLERIKHLIFHYQEIASLFGYTLRVHSVCQHIHWEKILDKCSELGITNLHLSHKDSSSDLKTREHGYDMKLHGWPLIAVNYVIPERTNGMIRKHIKEKSLLTSFIGAHMPHYRNDSRIKLLDAAKEYGKEDVFVDLGKEWHFNKIVYEEQTLNKSIKNEYMDIHKQQTFRYNSILSDSVFSLCPEGAGPNTLRFWESISIGSIPVIFSDDLSILKETRLGNELLKHCIIYNKDINSDLFNYLSSIRESDIIIRSNSIIDIYEKIHKKRCF